MEDKELKTAILQLAEAERKNTHLGWNFLKGVFYGFGVFVGSAVLVSLLIYIVSHVHVDGSTIIGKFFQRIIELIQQSKK